MNGISGVTDEIKSMSQSLKNGTDIEKAIGILRAELYAAFAETNNNQKQMIADNKAFIKNLGTELKRIIGEENSKSELLRRDINAYLENNNKLLNEVTKHLKEISKKVSKPVLIPPPMEIPKEMLKKLDKMIELQEMTHGELEGLYFYTIQKKVNTAGKPVRVADKRKTKSIVIIADATNTGNIYIGDRGVSASNAGAILRPGESIPMDVDFNKREVYLDSANNGDGVNCVIMAYREKTMMGGSR